MEPFLLMDKLAAGRLSPWKALMSKTKKRKSKKASTKELFEDCPEDVLADLMEDGFELE